MEALQRSLWNGSTAGNEYAQHSAHPVTASQCGATCLDPVRASGQAADQSIKDSVCILRNR